MPSSNCAVELTLLVAVPFLQSPAYRPTCIQARVPPTLNQPVDPSWKPPPVEWLLGAIKMTYSSIPEYFELYNIQSNIEPFNNVTGQHVDLTSYQVSANDSHVYTAYGIDTPHYNSNYGYEYTGVYDFRGNGTLSAVQNSWEVVAWGYDTDGIEFQALYETAVIPAAAQSPAGLDILSKSVNGPSAETLYAIYSAVAGLGNTNLTAILPTIKPLVHDGRRDGLVPVICNEACLNNTNLPSA